MNKLIPILPATLVLASTIATPAFAKKCEYNFNTCRYSFTDAVNPMSRNQAAVPTGNMNPGIGATNSAADRLRNQISVSVYEQTPQRTLIMPSFRPQVQSSNTNNNSQPQVQQRPVYYYVPGQNAKSPQTTSQSTGVSYQYNSSGAATYDSNSSNSK